MHGHTGAGKNEQVAYRPNDKADNAGTVFMPKPYCSEVAATLRELTKVAVSTLE